MLHLYVICILLIFDIISQNKDSMLIAPILPEEFQYLDENYLGALLIYHQLQVMKNTTVIEGA